MKSPLQNHHQRGAIIIAVMMFVAVFAMVGGAILLSAVSRYNTVQKTASWHEALFAAEAGVDVGLANVRWTVVPNSPTAFDPNANPTWWQDATGVWRCWLPSIPQTGEGTTQLWAMVEVDAPASLKDASGNQWYRIRSTGYANLPGLARANNDAPDGQSRHDNALRKFDLRSDHFIARYGDYAHAAGTQVAVSPQATRRIEVIAQPRTPFTAGVISMSPTIAIPLCDSYNSANTATWPGGLYSSAPRNPATGVGCHGNVLVNAAISTMSGQIYGDVGTNGGTVQKTSNISGNVYNSVSVSMPPVLQPTWTTGVKPVPSGSTITLPANGALQRYKCSNLDSLVVKLPAGTTTGSVEIWTTGDVTGGITIPAGVTCKIWFEGNFKMKARDIDNQNNRAINLQLYGITPSAGSRTFDLDSGNPGNRYFVLYAPAYDYTVNGNPDVCGSMIVRTVGGNGNTSLHYDESLAGAGTVIDYNRASWVEDTR